MGDSAVDRWKLEGRLHVWHYPGADRQWSGAWHLNADSAACESVADLIDRMLVAEWKTHKKIPVSIPRRMLVGRGYDWESASVFLIGYPKNETEDDFWQLEHMDGNVLSLTVGETRLREIKESLLGLPDWKDDFSLGPALNGKCRYSREEWARLQAERLWFWTKVE